MIASIFIALENYADSKQITDIKYSATDARALATILEQHGCDASHRELLINSEATKTSIESAIRTTLKQLTKDDTLYLFYAGHGYSQSGESFITCYDTRLADLEPTSIPLSWLLQQLKKAKCQRVVIFLDACHGALSEHLDPLDNYAAWDDAELREYFDSAKQSVCLTPCGTDERSHSSSQLKHGIWTHHLLQAFAGKSPAALQGSQLTAKSLQSYLTSEVPATLRTSAPLGVQTPRMFGAAHEKIVLADLAELLAQRKGSQQLSAEQVKDSILMAESINSVKRSPGFAKSKGHFIPEQHNSRAQLFINELASADIKEDVERIRAALKQAFRFTRVQLSVKNLGEGAATITTPFFNYNVSVEQDPDDPGSILWRRSVDGIIDPEKVLSKAFEQVFAELFDTVALSLRDKVDLDQLIDDIEAIDSDEIAVDYDEDEAITACVVRIKGHSLSIKITPRSFSVVHPKAAAPKRLLQSLFEVQRTMTQQHQILAIRFRSDDSRSSDHR
ncbi:MAG TPA: caspase family protein [Pirellulaceae bacterium]|nr:caspase family protein [Pirellulaceae bacterium]